MLLVPLALFAAGCITEDFVFLRDACRDTGCATSTSGSGGSGGNGGSGGHGGEGGAGHGGSPMATCGDQVRNGQETDVDCGGPSCAPCLTGLGCGSLSDCASRECIGGTCTATRGCSDTTREGFFDHAVYPNVASCAGGWSLPGVFDATTPTCARISGNDSPNPTGTGCSAADLCQIGWHVCSGPEDAAKNGVKTCDAAFSPGDKVFFATRVGGQGKGACDGVHADDLFGCGSLGLVTAKCGVLTQDSQYLCASLPAADWHCGQRQQSEAKNVTKSSSAAGGVLCCRGG